MRIELRRNGAGNYEGRHNGRPVFVIWEESAYGDRGWWWYVGNSRSDQPYTTKREAVASLHRNVEAAG